MLWSLVLDTEDSFALEVEAFDTLPEPLVTVVPSPCGLCSDVGCEKPGRTEMHKIDNDNKLVAPTLMIFAIIASPRLCGSRRIYAIIVPPLSAKLRRFARPSWMTRKQDISNLLEP